VSRAGAVVALLAAGLALVGCGSEARVLEGEGSATQGKELFTQKCGNCHVLADSGSRGNIGPNLDEAFRYVRDEKRPGQGFEESTIRDVIRGQIQYPVKNPVTGEPGMPGMETTLPKCEGGSDDQPQGCVEDPDEAADSIAAYVASVAGLPVQGTPGGTGSQDTDGETIFTSNCGTCHTLQAAGTSGAIGPNLDEAKPSVELAVDRVTNGQGAMPAFEGQLSEAQIQAVSEYVAQSAGG
jgi:mono/diheme cytochrome c family protein